MSDQQIYKRTVLKHEVPSKLLPEGQRNIRVYLPPGYNDLLSYPVVYCQDEEDFFNFGRIATQAQRLILEEGWEPFVIVGVDVDKRQRSSEYTPDGERYSLYTRFFVEELIPWTEARYPVRQSADWRVLAGDSLGGAVSLMLALDKTGLFVNVVSLSGAYYDLYQERIAASPNVTRLRVWMLVGLQEEAYETDRGRFDFVALNRQTRDLLRAKGARVAYTEKDGEHKWGFWQRELATALGAFLGPDRGRVFR